MRYPCYPLLLVTLLLSHCANGGTLAALSPVEKERLARVAEVRPSPRQLAWQRLELTGFVCFGINTFTNREWGTGKEDPKLFAPTNLDCRQWARALKSAGIRLAILTAKHHDGFCLWPTATTTFSVASSPWKEGKGDVVREFVDACRAEGLKVGLYLSPWDRNAKCYGSPAYNEFFLAQLDELLTHYGPIDEMWFDGACGEGPNGKRQVYDWARFYTLIRKRQPNCVIAVSGPDVRWVGNESGIARESEWSVIPAGKITNATVSEGFRDFHYDGDDLAAMERRLELLPLKDRTAKDIGSLKNVLSAENWVWYPAECDVSIRPGWYWHASQDSKVKSLEQLLRIYDCSVGRNAVLLLNVPPTSEGRFHPTDVARLKAFGDTIRETFAQNLLGEVKPGQTEVTLKTPVTADVLVVQEDIAKGQRVERFRIEIRRPEKDTWESIAAATTIGHKRILRLSSPVTFSALRLVIEESRATPHILMLGAYKAPANVQSEHP